MDRRSHEQSYPNNRYYWVKQQIQVVRMEAGSRDGRPLTDMERALHANSVHATTCK